MNPLLGQVLGGVLANAAQRRGVPGFGGLGGGSGSGMGMGGLGGLGGSGGGLGGLGGGLGGLGMAGVLAGMLGGRRGAGFGGRGAMLAMLLPIAMQWVQRNGGLGAVLQRVQDRGMQRHASSWVRTGENEPLDPQALDDIVGPQELARISGELGVPQDEVRHGFAELLPEMVNQLTPDGQVRPDADHVLADSIPLMEDQLRLAQRETI